MAEQRLSAWEALFARALVILNSAALEGTDVGEWSLGGGTALMLSLRHRGSRDIEISVPDAELLEVLSPRLNAAAEALTRNYVEHASFIKLYFPEGEIDFVASASLVADPVAAMRVLGREVPVETPSEIIAKLIWRRAASFTARDVFDLACVAERQPVALLRVRDFLAARRAALLRRLDEREAALREDFAALDALGFRPDYDQCLAAIRALFARIAPPNRAEQMVARYEVLPCPIHARTYRGIAVSAVL